MQRIVLAACLACLGACERTSSAARPTLVRIDTLAGGVLSIRSHGPEWRDSTEGWTLVEEVRYGGAEGTPGELLNPQSFTADAAGRLYVVDSKPSIIKVFNPNGSFQRTMGREGSGPGEFRVGFIATRGDRIALHDPGEGRTSVFDTSGTFVKSSVTFCCYWGDIAIDTARRIVIPAFITGRAGEPPKGVPYARYGLDLAPIDTIWVPDTVEERVWMFRSAGPDGKQNVQMTMLVPWTPRVHHGLHPWGGVVRGVSDAFRVVRAPTGRDSTWVASTAWKGEPIPEAQRVARRDQAVKSASQSVGEGQAKFAAKLEDLPTTAPAFTRLEVDEDGNTWARQLLGSDSNRTTFVVLDPRGAWSGSVRVPYGIEEYGGAYFGKGKVYLKTEDDEGRPLVVRLRVVAR
ncbi:MAG: hypothetical protein H7066_04690 [Cytophagaceae bacterium]|nr:hypothetical protein [Gemmatimonadaceae bacterium]